MSQESLIKTLASSELSKELDLRVEARNTLQKPQEPDPLLLLPQEAPGMLLKHYSPHIATFIIGDQSKLTNLKETVLIDFAQQHATIRSELAWYADLSPEGNVKEAISNIYEYLRLAELKPGIKRILLANIKSSSLIDCKLLHKEHLEALFDRMFRASAGKYCTN